MPTARCILRISRGTSPAGRCLQNFLVAVVLLATLLGVSACTRRLDSNVPGTGLLIAQIRITMDSKSADFDLGDFEYLLVEKEGREEPPLRGTFNEAADGVYVFNDIPPGRYRLHKGFVRTTNLPGKNAGVEVPFSNHPECVFTEVLPGTITSLGAYDVRLVYDSYVITLLPKKIEITDGPGTAAQQSGLEQFKERWPQGYWADLARLQLRGAY